MVEILIESTLFLFSFNKLYIRFKFCITISNKQVFNTMNTFYIKKSGYKFKKIYFINCFVMKQEVTHAIERSPLVQYCESLVR